MINERRERLLAVTRASIDAFNAEALSKLPLIQDLATQAGYKDAAQVSSILKQEGLDVARKQAEKRRMETPLPPSPELAWIMGYFSEHGAPLRDSIVVTDNTPDTLSKFIRYSKRAFDYVPHPARSGEKKSTVFIHSKEIVSRIGNISLKDYANTLQERYSWIKKERQYMWPYLEGLIDAKGHLKDNRITIHVKDPELAKYLLSILQMVGVERPTMHFVPSSDYWTVNISTSSDMQYIAENIRLETPHKEEKLKKKRPHRNHYWKIETPNGPTSMGICTECGQQREFSNSITIRYKYNE